MTTPPPTGNEAEFDFAPFGYHQGSSGSSFGGRSIDIVRFLFSIWKPLIIGAMLGVLMGMAVYLYIGPVYTASTQIMVSRPPSVPDRDGPANSFGERGDHLKLMKTDEIILRAFQQHGLKDIPELAESYDPLKSVSEDMSVSRSSGQESSFDNILEVAYSNPNKVIARQVVQAIVESYRDYLVDIRKEKSQEVYDVLLKQQKDYEDRIATEEQAYHTFRREAPVFLKASPIITINGMPAQPQSQAELELGELEKAQRDNTRRRAGIEARLATLDQMLSEGKQREVVEFWVMHSLSTGTATNSSSGGGGAGGAAALAGPPAKAALDQQLLTARLLEQRLLHALGQDHASVRNVRQQIDTILDFYRRQGLTPPVAETSSTPNRGDQKKAGLDMVGVYQQMLEEQLKEIDADDEKLALLHEDAQKRAKDAELFEIEDQRRKDEIARLKKQADQNFAQIASYDIAHEQEGYRMKQISQVRIERSFKQVIKIVGACTVLCIAAVFCLAYFREWSDTRMKGIDEVREVTGRPLLGSVPTFVSSPDADRLAAEGPLHPVLCYYHRPGSREAEAYRSIRTSLFHGLKQGAQIIQISSPEPGDGKSTTAANLAIAIAQSGKKVLLIDCDLRRPTQHGLFKIPQENGLTDVLLREATWRNVLRNTVVEGLSVMTAGLCPQNPAELLSTHVLPQMLQDARRLFDIIILDSPPILVVSDPSIVAPCTDGMLLVVRMLKSKRLTLQRSREMLDAHGIDVLGVIANDFTTTLAEQEGLSYDAYSGYYNTERARSAKAHPVVTTDA